MSRREAFTVLGLSENATPEEIKSAFRSLAKIHHPDRFQEFGHEAAQTANFIFQRINLAYLTLIDN